MTTLSENSKNTFNHRFLAMEVGSEPSIPLSNAINSVTLALNAGSAIGTASLVEAVSVIVASGKCPRVACGVAAKLFACTFAGLELQCPAAVGPGLKRSGEAGRHQGRDRDDSGELHCLSGELSDVQKRGLDDR